mmetsp:Transcript_5846/g.12036  ORF Transcript_5846/g.12036 Transcript_5846/m.12036 type:complete len:468 (-) Transcript_5846:199-1602(-)|eukprot:CAMPEP_0197278778 /NCGR_PEP_ID=MMETSP1432-20130617/19172_1 /TAXON_ID=44447 /ORGANISM="Pseudo-nitzschia delicatissima, Strain UNC1205" /LENGTH=467 /DNA_ID=CAMNT_0042745209 /DNA_START=238 /DNA_END=1641 /DNA_ORIENTATION=+
MAMNISRPNAPSSDPNAKRTIKIPDAADSLLASELNSMTVADRTHVFEEIHGVAPFPKEENSSEALERSLHLLSEALDRIEEKPAFDEAQRMVREEGATTFVNDDYFRLRFLRAEEFRPQQAAERMVQNLELLHRYVGQEGLRRPIRMSDLDETSIAVMKTGSFQLLPSRDRSGRRIAVRIGPLGLDFIKNENSMMKMLLYIFHCLSEDLESQKRGIVMVSFPCINFDPSTISDPKAKRLISQILEAIGVRISANHLCFPDKPWFRALGSLFMMASTQSVRVRTRLHYGSITECQYKIMSYGIPSDQLPIKNSGTIKLQNHKKWIAFRETKDIDMMEEHDGYAGGTFCPSTKDVLAIGGMHFYKFRGNCRYRELLELNLESYDNAENVQEKIRITNQVLQVIESSGGRFLVRDKKGWWVPANEQTARGKVSNAFRDVRKSIRARENRRRLKSETHKFAAVETSRFSC